LRRAHFPPERNHLTAHVTLFHALPPSGEGELRDLLARLAADNPAPAAVLDCIISLGRGTALHLVSPAMLELRQQIADRFHGMLTAQDSSRPRLHITVQNKVSPVLARALQAELAGSFRQRHFTFAGLGLHAYMGGPWQSLGRWSFRGT
jgi:hypothetical protein